jgi:hypothetical protein
MDILSSSETLLIQTGFFAKRVSLGDRDIVLFEDATVLGFLFAYVDATSLLSGWKDDVSRAISSQQFSLRRGGTKTWNAYVILLAEREANYGQSVAVAAIEEDLTGTRKIARCGVADPDDVRAALLPLLPFQSAPRLDAVDISAEIRVRASEVPKKILDVFLSDADQAVVVQVLEEAT